MQSKKVRIGMIGYRFMGKAHSLAYRNLPFYFDTKVEPVLQAIAGRNSEEVRKASRKLGWQEAVTDWRSLMERNDIDVIDIVSPNQFHAEMSIAAAQAGKHIICEKPLAVSLAEAKRMEQEAIRAGVTHMVCFNYRFSPAVQMAKLLISEGRLGVIRHIRATYLQDWLCDPEFPLLWRLTKQSSGSGALGDLASHMIDLARYLVGEISEVTGMMNTFISQRPLPDNDASINRYKNVDVDDGVAFLARFANGASGVFEASRISPGNRNGNRFEINGEKGSICWDLENLNMLHVYFEKDDPGLQGFRAIHCTESLHPYAGAYWPPGHSIGYEHTFINMMKEFMGAISGDENALPDFKDGLRNQSVLSAVEQSDRTGAWVKITE